VLFELVDDHSKLKPVAFGSFSQIARTEKNLEDLLAAHLFDTLFGQTPLLPFHQETPYEPVADIYALNQNGDVVIFELKREAADVGALDQQLLRYAQEAAFWGYTEIQRKYLAYAHKSEGSISLKEAHRQAFNLEAGRELREDQFNRQQHLWVVGSAGADQLIRAVDYWKSKGLSIDFFPYRVYQLDAKYYFEFFAKPYDRHLNPAFSKGVLFDTNRTCDYLPDKLGYGCLQDMLAKRRVAAYGDRKEAVLCFQTHDYAFYSHPGCGIVGAAKIRGRNVQKVRHSEYEDEWYWDVEVLTPVPEDFARIPAMSFADVQTLLAKTFFWARIDKRPYLSREESEGLLDELRKALGAERGPEVGDTGGLPGHVW
jgi:hypothetical protein